MRTIWIDGRALMPRDRAHEVLAAALSLPAYYGRNLDALHDCLTDVGRATALMIGHAATLRDDAYGSKLLRVMVDAAQANPHLSVQLMD